MCLPAALLNLGEEPEAAAQQTALAALVTAQQAAAQPGSAQPAVPTAENSGAPNPGVPGQGGAPAPVITQPVFPTAPGAPTQPAAQDTQPAPQLDISLPGKIVYTCYDGEFDQICLMNADGSQNRQLTFEKATSYYPSLSPDGEAIVFSSRR